MGDAPVQKPTGNNDPLIGFEQLLQGLASDAYQAWRCRSIKLEGSEPTVQVLCCFAASLNRQHPHAMKR